MALSTLFIQTRSKMQQPIHQFKQEKKLISVQTKQMLTKLNNKCVKAVLQMNLIQCFQCTHTPITIKIHTPHPLPHRAREKAGWEPELHSGVQKNLFPCQESNYDASAVKPLAFSIHQLCYLSSDTCIHQSCRVHTAANFITTRLKNAVQ